MKKSYEALSRLGNALDLPLSYAAGLPLVELRGYDLVRVEGHRGVLEYGETRVELGSAGARIRITGHGLGLKALSVGQAVVTGQIGAVEFVPEEAP